MDTIKLWMASLILLLGSCTSSTERLKHEQIIEKYIQGLNRSDFNIFAEHISDSIYSSESSFVLSENKNQFYRLFQWDSVFLPQYKIIEFKKVDQQIEAVISKLDQRINFLHDSAIVYKVLIDFSDQKITKMQTFEHVVFDFEKWQLKRDRLVLWIDENHPDLSGFINDQSIQGSLNYMKAIELYKNR